MIHFLETISLFKKNGHISVTYVTYSVVGGPVSNRAEGISEKKLKHLHMKNQNLKAVTIDEFSVLDILTPLFSRFFQDPPQYSTDAFL